MEQFAIECRQCGGAVGFSMQAETPKCPHCAAESCLGPELAEKIRIFKADLLHRAREEQRLSADIWSRVEDFKVIGTMYALVPWVLLLLVILFVAPDRPEGMGWMQFFATAWSPGHDPASDPAFLWWLVFLLVTGVTIAFLLISSGTVILASMAGFMMPLAPVRVDGQPLCRCCGAELPPGGPLRRCHFCAAESLLMGTAYKKSVRNMVQAVEGFSRQLRKSSRQRSEDMGHFALWYGNVSALLALVGPIVYFWFGLAADPRLWILPVIFAGAGLVFSVWRGVQPKPSAGVFIRAGS